VKGAIVLAHGAGSNADAAILVRVANAFTERGYLAARINLAFRQQRPSGPPRPSDYAADQASIRDALASARAQTAGPVIVGGHSYGGRQATMLAAAEPGVADSLFLLAYPLHPPGKADQLRTAHFPALRTPAFFIHGDRDTFATPEELRQALTLIPAATHLEPVEKTGHDLGKLKAGPVVERFLAWMESL
jgi:hypothetical protein